MRKVKLPPGEMTTPAGTLMIEGGEGYMSEELAEKLEVREVKKFNVTVEESETNVYQVESESPSDAALDWQEGALVARMVRATSVVKVSEVRDA